MNNIGRKKVFVALGMASVAGQAKLAGIFRFLREKYGPEQGWNIKLIRTRDELTKESIEKAISEKTDGFIVSFNEVNSIFTALSNLSTPAVMTDAYSESLERRAENVVNIRISSELIGREAADYLMSLGVARSYAFLHSSPKKNWSWIRFEAFRKTLADNGLWSKELYTPEEVLKLKRPVAIFAACDNRAYDLLNVLSSRKIRVPGEAVVLGVDNDPLICENSHPRLSSIQPHFEEEGYLAAKALDAMMHGEKPESNLLYSGIKRLVRRESTGELSTAGRMIQKALAYIDRHALEGIGVEDVVKHLRCSRSLADLRFRQLQNRTILQAITERRLTEVRERLRGTRETIESIAAACGYKNSNYLKNLFKKQFGMSMSTFRTVSGLKIKNPNR